MQAKRKAILQLKCMVPEIFQICPEAGGNETEPVQVVVATNPAARICHVITVYRPDLERFEPGFRIGRKRSIARTSRVVPCAVAKATRHQDLGH